MGSAQNASQQGGMGDLIGSVLGGVLGGVLFLDFGFLAFGVAGAGLGAILVHDVIVGRLAASDRAETSGLRAQPR